MANLLNGYTRNGVCRQALGLKTFMFFLLLSGCAVRQQSQAPPTATAPVDQAIWDTYNEAVQLAANPTARKIYYYLTPVRRDTDGLKWRTIAGEPHVLVSSWAGSFKYYQPFVGAEKPYATGDYQTWVTLAPFLQKTCGDPAWAGNDLEMRLRQVLGLPPDDQKEGFVSIWVRPADLFRPCPDPEIDDEQCDLCLPIDIDDAHRKWFNQLRATSYNPPREGYPWTQLGYTFDWSNNALPVGFAEYIIRKNVTVYIESLVPTRQYCGGS